MDFEPRWAPLPHPSVCVFLRICFFLSHQGSHHTYAHIRLRLQQVVALLQKTNDDGVAAKGAFSSDEK